MVSEEERPVFLFSIHRSGGTLLARLLNSDPRLLIWGEHAGFINRLAEIDEVLSLSRSTASAIMERDLLGWKHERRTTSFEPWINPVDPVNFRSICRDYLQCSFGGDNRFKRWGFKEIRYHSLRTARFLRVIYPASKIILLKRSLEHLVLANIAAPWSISSIDPVVRASQPLLRQVIDDCSYAITVIHMGFKEIEEDSSVSALTLDYEGLVRAPEGTMSKVCDFIDLPDFDVHGESFYRALNSHEGETHWPSAREQVDVDFVRSEIPGSLARASEEISCNGIDWERLRSNPKNGRYFYLVGDHELLGTGHSTIF